MGARFFDHAWERNTNTIFDLLTCSSNRTSLNLEHSPVFFEHPVYILPLCANVGHLTEKSYRRRRDEAREQEIWNDGDPACSREELFHPLYLTHHQAS